MKTQRVSCGRSDDGTMRVMLTIAAVLALILIFSVFYAAGRPKPLPPVAAPHLATESGTQSRPQERMWMKEYMEQNGPSEELKARRARMGRFQQTGNAGGGG